MKGGYLMPFYKLEKSEIKEIKKQGTGYRENSVLDNKGLVVKSKGSGKNSSIITVYKKGVNPRKPFGQNDSIDILKTKQKGYKVRYDIIG